MRTKIWKRLEIAEHRIVNRPVPRRSVDRAFDVFRETGELPQDARIAGEVIAIALQCRRGSTDLRTGIRELKALADAIERGDELPPSPDRCRRQLYNEAVYGEGDRKAAAREALMQQARLGVDVTSGDFLRDEPLPAFGAVGLHMTGYYERLAQGPDGDRVRALYAKLERMTAEHSGDDAWWDAVLAAVRVFGDDGRLPDDAEQTKGVAVLAELCELCAAAKVG